MGRCLQGRHIDNVPTLVAELRPLIDDHPGRVALSGIEQAIWDLVGQAAGMPVAALLGGPNFAEVQVYANINRETLDRSPTSFAASAARGEAFHSAVNGTANTRILLEITQEMRQTRGLCQPGCRPGLAALFSGT